MEDWEKDHILHKLPRLIQVTNCNVDLLTNLNKLFSQTESEFILSRNTTSEKAYSFYRTAIQKDNGYDQVALALQASKQTGALKIIKEGYRINNKPKPEGLRDSLVSELTPPKLLQMVKFELQGRLVTLGALLGTDITPEAFSRIRNAIKDKWFRSEPLKLVKDTCAPPVLPKYYITRTILNYTPPAEVQSNIFVSGFTKEHVFLFKDANKFDLAKISGYKARDTSGNQLQKVTVRFIALELDEDFDKICKITNKPVHVIQRDGERYFWIMSRGGMDVIKTFFTTERRSSGEEHLAMEIATLAPPCSISIADSPGMGKSLLMASVAQKIRERDPSIHLFITAQEFANQLIAVNSSLSALEALAAHCAHDDIAKSVLQEVLQRITHLYLYLDGYDEVHQEKLHLINTFLEHVKAQRNVKMIVTTRSHFKTSLENIFNQFAYEVLPFDLSNQIKFLTSYWTTKHGCCECEALEQFARRCLAALETKMTDKEKKIAGIPLQCMMLAEVFAEYGARACKIKFVPDVGVIIPTSLFTMFKSLMDLKFRRFKEANHQQMYLNAHVHHAIELLFPEYVDNFNSILGGYSYVNEATMYSIGLIEQCGPITQRYVHRTFAEYLAAEFLVKNLSNSACADLMFRGILGRQGLTFDFDFTDTRVSGYELKHPVISYFVEMHLQNSSVSLQPPLPRPLSERNFNDEDLCAAAGACCNYDLEQTFKYVTEILKSRDIPVELRDRYLKLTPHVVVKYTNNHSLLLNVLEFIKSKFTLDWDYHVMKYIDAKETLWDNFSPLHMAAAMGKYNMVTWLVDEYMQVEYQWSKLRFMLHITVLGSAYESVERINEKICIVDMLIGLNPDWVEEKSGLDNMTPLFESNVHISLLQRLVYHKANINTCSSKLGTLLHRPRPKSTYTELVQWAFANGFTLVNGRNGWGDTPLMSAIEKYGSVDDEVLELFSEKGTDWSAQNVEGDSVLFYALEFGENVEFIVKLLNLGLDLNHKNKRNRNAAHKVIENERLNPTEKLEVWKVLKSKGFSGFDEQDFDCQTLMTLAPESFGEEIALYNPFQ